MPPIPYSVKKVPGLRRSKGRAVIFLECAGEGGIDANEVFGALKPKTQMMLKTRFEYWIDNGKFDDYFHGWPNHRKYKDCFVFKWNEGPRRRRVYGFLTHPIAEGPAFQVCVLAIHRYKSKPETDQRNLDLIVALSNDSQVMDAVRKAFV